MVAALSGRLLGGEVWGSIPPESAFPLLFLFLLFGPGDSGLGGDVGLRMDACLFL